MKTVKYKIIPDQYLGYEVRIWRIWWPFWVQCDLCNTYKTIENAKKYIDNRRNPIYY